MGWLKILTPEFCGQHMQHRSTHYSPSMPGVIFVEHCRAIHAFLKETLFLLNRYKASLKLLDKAEPSCSMPSFESFSINIRESRTQAITRQ